MRILIFTENMHCGGLDSFLITLINHWPNSEDDLMIMCNREHPGFQVLEEKVVRRCRVSRHNIGIYAELVVRARGKGVRDRVRRAFSPLLKLVYFAYNVLAIIKVFAPLDADRLMVVNGGHPAGDSCRAAVLAWRLAKPKKPRPIYNFHGLATRPRWFERPYERLLDRVVFASAGSVVGVSQACAESLRPRIGDARMCRVKWIYNGIATPRQQASSSLRQELGLSESTSLCLMLSTYEAGKGHDFLLRAFKRVAGVNQNVYLLICGYGYPNEIATVRSLIRLHGLVDRVILQGFRKDADSLLQQADVLLISSQLPESFGLTAAEAMANGTPVVATRVGGIPEVVADDQGGFCVDRTDVEGFAAHVIALLESSRLRSEQGLRGKARVDSLFLAPRMASEYAAIIHGLG